MTLEPRDRTTQSMRTQQYPSGPGETPRRWRGAYISTDVNENTTHPSYVPKAKPHSQTHTYLEVADSPPSSEQNATIVPSDSYSNSYKKRMEDDGPSYVRTWATSPSHTLITSWSTSTLPHIHTTKALNTQHMKAYKTTNKKTRTTHNPYPTTSYTHNINPDITNQPSSKRLASRSTRKTN